MLQLIFASHRRRCAASAAALLIGMAALAASEPTASDVSWESLLAPYSHGDALPEGFRIDTIRRGAGNDIVIELRRLADEEVGVEVHVVRRGLWPGIRESQSFGIGYETPRSPAPQRELVTEALAEAIRSRDRGLPAPDAIALGPAFDPSVLPWWLEMLRGGRGLLLGASLALLAVLALIGSPHLAHAGFALAAIDLIASLVGIPLVSYDIGAVWTVPATVALLYLASRRLAAVARADQLSALVVFAIALGLRLALGVWGPMHANGLGALWVIGAARDPAAIATYGPGFAEIFGWITALWPSSPDWALFAANAAVSAAVPVVAFALGRLAGIARPTALTAALLLAIDPVSVHMAATESYFPIIMLLCTGAAAVLLIAARAMAIGDQWRAAAAIAAAGLLLVQVSRIHPVAWGVIALLPAVVLAGNASNLSRRMLVFLASTALIVGILVAFNGSGLLDVYGRVRAGTLMQPHLSLSRWPLVWVAAGAVAYALLAPRPWLAVAAALSVAGLLISRHTYWQSWIWQQSYDRLYLTLPVVALIGVLPASLLRRRWFAAILALLVIATWLRSGLPVVTSRTTDQLEYRWLRQQIAQLPTDCRIIHVVSAGKRALVIPTYIGPGSRPAVALDLRQPHTIEAGLSPTPCLYYVRTSLCSGADGGPVCDELEQRLTFTPVAHASFPALRSHIGFPYDRDPVETLLARVQRIDGVELDPP